MKKQDLLCEIIQQLEKDRSALMSAALETYEAATGEESQAENQYDTRALEASYLAQAQSKRVLEIERSIHIYKHLELKDFKNQDPIGPTALVEVSNEGRQHLVFLTPTAGGMSLKFEDKMVQVITPKSPLGEALVGLTTGDIANLDKGSETLEYEILSVT